MKIEGKGDKLPNEEKYSGTSIINCTMFLSNWNTMWFGYQKKWVNFLYSLPHQLGYPNNKLITTTNIKASVELKDFINKKI